MPLNNSKSTTEDAIRKQRINYLNRIQPFEPQRMTPTMTAAIFAPRGSGKSVLIKELMFYKIKHYDLCIVCCPSADARQTYAGVVGNEFIFDEEKDIMNCIKNVVNEQQKYTQSGIALRIFLILDDVGYLEDIPKMKEYKKLFLNGRHLEIGLIAIYQYPKALSPVFRRNLDYIMFLSQEAKDIDGIHEDIFKGSINFQDLKWLFETITANRGVLIIKQERTQAKKTDAPIQNVMDKLYHYTADIGLPHFQIGSRGIWKMHCMFSRSNLKKRVAQPIPLFGKKQNKIELQEDDESEEERYKIIEDIKTFQQFKSKGKLEPINERPIPLNTRSTNNNNHDQSYPKQEYQSSQMNKRTEFFEPVIVNNENRQQQQNRKKIDSLVRSYDEIDNQSYKAGISELGSSISHAIKNFNYDQF